MSNQFTAFRKDKTIYLFYIGNGEKEEMGRFLLPEQEDQKRDEVLVNAIISAFDKRCAI